MVVKKLQLDPNSNFLSTMSYIFLGSILHEMDHNKKNQQMAKKGSRLALDEIMN